MTTRYIDFTTKQQTFHLVVKGTGRNTRSSEWIFSGRKRANLLEKFKQYLTLYPAFTLITHCEMSSHLHLIVKADYTHETSRPELKEAYRQVYDREVHPNSHPIRVLIRDQHDLSKLMQRFQHDTAWKFNREKNFKRTGHLWAARFHSTLLGSAKALMRCAVYVLMNPVKAKIAPTPTAWKWNSLNDSDSEKILADFCDAYNSMTGDEALTLEQFRSLLTERIKMAIAKLKKASKIEILKESQLWNYAGAVGDPNLIEQFNRTIYETNTPDIVWVH